MTDQQKNARVPEYGTETFRHLNSHGYYKDITCFINDTQYITRVVGLMMIYYRGKRVDKSTLVPTRVTTPPRVLQMHFYFVMT